MKLNLSELENILGSSVINSDVTFEGISIDSRTIKNNELYIPIKGENFDGHKFILDAVNNGACALITEKEYANIPYIKVADTKKALGLIATYYSGVINPTIIGITGTNGKTSVTNMTASILNYHTPTLKTFKNFNNQIGLPLSILKAEKKHQAFVLEMGASKKGDIKELVEIARPSIITILNVSPAHLDTFGSVDNILSTKEEILLNQDFSKKVILNKDDKYFERWAEKSNKHQIITISAKQVADYYVVSSTDNTLVVKTPSMNQINIKVKDSVSYTINNILFSVALASEAGANAENIISGINNMLEVEGRFAVIDGYNGSSLIDSTYNANPASFKSTIDSLMQLTGVPWLIMGEMGELGDESQRYHIEVARYAREAGIKKLFVISRHADAILNEFGTNSYSFETNEQLIESVKPHITSNLNILIKASRFMKYEVIVNALAAGKY